jgi:alcohol dehydrogenase
MLGAAHAAANPLTAHFDVVHGHAVGLMLPHVVRFNGAEERSRQIYARLAQLAGIVSAGPASKKSCDALCEHLSRNLELASLPRSLSECSVKRDSIPVLAQEAAKQWTVNFNPRQVTEKDFVQLYEAAW